MKKIMSILLTLSLIAGTVTVAFAEGNDNNRNNSKKKHR